MMPMHRQWVAPPFGAVEFRSALALFFHARGKLASCIPESTSDAYPICRVRPTYGFSIPQVRKAEQWPFAPIRDWP